MNISDNVSYELAKKLKALGFNLPCVNYYTKDDAPDDQVWLTNGDAEDYNNLNDGNPFVVPVCSAPSYHTALQWMREKYKIHCFAVIDDDCEEGQEEVWQGANQLIKGGMSLPMVGRHKSWLDAIEEALNFSIRMVSRFGNGV